MFGIKNWGKFETETNLEFSELIQTEDYLRARASIPDGIPLGDIPKVIELIAATRKRKRIHHFGFSIFLTLLISSICLIGVLTIVNRSLLIPAIPILGTLTFGVFVYVRNIGVEKGQINVSDFINCLTSAPMAQIWA